MNKNRLTLAKVKLKSRIRIKELIEQSFIHILNIYFTYYYYLIAINLVLMGDLYKWTHINKITGFSLTKTVVHTVSYLV